MYRGSACSGLNYWLGQLNSDVETNYEVLLGFAESRENKALFTEMSGFCWSEKFKFFVRKRLGL